MAPKKGQRVAGAYLDLKQLVRDQGPTLVMFRLAEFLDPEPAQGFKGTNWPVVADARICDGDRAGELWDQQKFMGGITGPLRGVPNAKDKKDGLPPENKIGEEIVLRVKLTNEGKPNEGAVGDEPSDAEFNAAMKFYEDNGGEAGFWEPKPRAKAAASSGGAEEDPW